MIEELEKERDYLLRGHKAIFNQHPSKRALQKHIKKLWELLGDGHETDYRGAITLSDIECKR